MLSKAYISNPSGNRIMKLIILLIGICCASIIIPAKKSYNIDISSGTSFVSAIINSSDPFNANLYKVLHHKSTSITLDRNLFKNESSYYSVIELGYGSYYIELENKLDIDLNVTYSIYEDILALPKYGIFSIPLLNKKINSISINSINSELFSAYVGELCCNNTISCTFTELPKNSYKLVIYNGNTFNKLKYDISYNSSYGVTIVIISSIIVIIIIVFIILVITQKRSKQIENIQKI